ncbi:MAG TPA: phospholipid carrier-dependent glycosyltransferase [Streptosporangiaceae bacterium]|nr:phospholipid carrier-dependent glycosyltransferase [Streptosporangiaceae bacterium]
MPGSEFWGWAGPLLVTAFGAFLRFNRLGVPKSIIFDETYYVPDALGILHYGVEHNYVSSRNALLAHGNSHIFTSGGEFVVHPPLGKLFITFGEWTFGLNSFGWRFATALIGSLAILLLARIARRMTRSTLLGCVAGLLMALDGLEFVMSRTALLDIFLMFWVLAAFGCLVVDRDISRARLATQVEQSPGSLDGIRPTIRWWQIWAGDGTRPAIRWWRIGAGVCIGLACASKWDAIWYLLGFAGLAIAWDAGARRAAGLGDHLRGALRQNRSLPVSFGLVPLVVYLLTWAGWFFSSIGYDRQWAAQHGDHVPVISALSSFVEYQKQILQFHLGLTTHHPYQSQPWTWLVMSRPVAFFWTCPAGGGHGTCASGKAQEVLAIGTPLIWWASIGTLIVCIGWWLTRRDWRPGALLLCVGVGWLPWFWFALHDHRTEFFFYALEFEPFLILSITLCLGLIIGSTQASATRRTIGAAVTGAYLLGVLLNFAYLYPIIAGKVIPYSSWLSHMWYHGWI